MKDLELLKANSDGSDQSLGEALEAAKSTVHDCLCDSFNTQGMMYAMSDLVSRFNTADKTTVNLEHVEQIARWLTSMVNMLGLNGSATPDTQDIGWSGIDVPEEAKPYQECDIPVYPCSTRYRVRELSKQ